MEIGMLWYDDSPIALKDRVNRAAGYYSEKYGRKPNLCFVHPGMLQAEEGNAQGVVIRKGKGVMPGHFWIGVDESQVKKNGNSEKPINSKSASKSKSAGISTTKVKAPSSAKSQSKTTAKSSAEVKSSTAKKSEARAKSSSTTAAAKKTKAATAKAGAAKAVPAKKPKAKPASAKPRKRIQALLKKKSGKRVKAGGKPKSKSKSARAPAKT